MSECDALEASTSPSIIRRQPSGINNKANLLHPPPVIQRDTNEDNGCWRRCPSIRRNHIVVNFNGEAGLSDRYYIIERMADIAGYLCANLHIPSPSTWLAAKHNRGVPLSMNVAWSDYQNWSWTMPDIEGTPLFHTLYEVGNQTSSIAMSNDTTTKLYSMEQLLKGHKLPHERTWHSTIEIRPSPQHHLIADPSKGLGQILQLIDIVDDQWKQIGNGVQHSDIGEFLWEIPVDPYHMNIFDDQIRVAMIERNSTIPPSFPENLPRGTKGCQYVSTEPSFFVDEVVQRVWNEVSDPTATIGFLHVRRGDATDQCNTTISKLQSYLDCTFANTTKYGNITMLLATDETDPMYLNDVKSTLEAMYPHVKVIHLDPLVENHVEKFAKQRRLAGDPAHFVGNFFTFQVENVIRYQRAAFIISQRRFECNACDALSGWHKVKWVGRRLDETIAVPDSSQK